MSLETFSGEYERAIIIQTPASTNAGRYASQINSLPIEKLPIPARREDGAPIEDDARRLWDKMYKYIEPGDLLVVPSGDGLLHWVVNGLMQEEAVENGLNKLPLLPVLEGNACDVGMQISGKHRVEDNIRHGRTIDLRPLEVSVTPEPSMGRIRRALGYFSVGATAAAAERLDALKYSRNPLARFGLTRKLIEAPLTLHTVARAPALVFAHSDDERFEANDRLFVTGNRIAKYGRPHADLTAEEFEEFVSCPAGYASALRALLKMQQGRLEGEMRTDVSFRVELPKSDTPQDPTILVQYDGERAKIQSGSEVGVHRSKDTYRVLSQILQAGETS